MEISIKRNYGFELIFKAENVLISEDIEDRIYDKKEDGKSDFAKPPFRDINNQSIEMLSNVLSDLIYYRQRDFDSSNLITLLFEKLPVAQRTELVNKIYKDYEPESL